MPTFSHSLFISMLSNKIRPFLFKTCPDRMEVSEVVNQCLRQRFRCPIPATIFPQTSSAGCCSTALGVGGGIFRVFPNTTLEQRRLAPHSARILAGQRSAPFRSPSETTQGAEPWLFALPLTAPRPSKFSPEARSRGRGRWRRRSRGLLTGMKCSAQQNPAVT